MPEKLKVLDLFSGIGGFSLGLERTGGFETVAFCEIDDKCRDVLSKHWPDVPIFNDVRSLNATGLGRIDCITGGYPCQPFSYAGKREGEEDDRHLWPAMFALVKKLRPAWVIGENVAGHISMGLDSVLSDLEAESYTARTFVVPACAVDAKHRRDRLWIVANTNNILHERELDAGRDQGTTGTSEGRDKRQGQAPHGKRIWLKPSSGRKVLAYTSSERQQGSGPFGNARSTAANGKGKAAQSFNGCELRKWPIEPRVGRVANGIPGRVDRLKQLGNAVVPQIPELIGRAILEAMAAE